MFIDCEICCKNSFYLIYKFCVNYFNFLEFFDFIFLNYSVSILLYVNNTNNMCVCDRMKNQIYYHVNLD